VRRQPNDKTASFPNLRIAAFHGLLHLSAGLFVVSAFEIFGTPKVIGSTDDVRAIPSRRFLTGRRHRRPRIFATQQPRQLLIPPVAISGFHWDSSEIDAVGPSVSQLLLAPWSA